MPNPFDNMVSRMDAATVATMGKTAIINGTSVSVVPAGFLEEMGPLMGNGLSLVVFSTYTPKRNDVVDYEGTSFAVTRHDIFNGKPRIFIE